MPDFVYGEMERGCFLAFEEMIEHGANEEEIMALAVNSLGLSEDHLRERLKESGFFCERGLRDLFNEAKRLNNF